MVRGQVRGEVRFLLGPKMSYSFIKSLHTRGVLISYPRVKTYLHTPGHGVRGVKISFDFRITYYHTPSLTPEGV